MLCVAHALRRFKAMVHSPTYMSHLLAFLKPDETAAELIARTHVDPIHTGLHFASTLRPGQVLEVSGPSGAAKTEILAQVNGSTIVKTC